MGGVLGGVEEGVVFVGEGGEGEFEFCWGGLLIRGKVARSHEHTREEGATPR